VVVIAVILFTSWAVRAQEVRSLSLEEALALATGTDEQLVVARAGVKRAEANVERTESQRKPQLGLGASYQRTILSQFEGLGGGSAPEVPPECQEPYVADPSLPLEERVAILERRIACPDGGGLGGIDFTQLGFGAANAWNLGLDFNWPLFTGGRVEAQTRAAEELEKIAEANITATDAQVRLDVTAAYFDAALAAELVEISEASVAQAEETLRITSLRANEGAQAEFDVLQARVTRDNQQPPLIRSRAQRDLAFDRLRALLDLPEDQPLRLTTPVTAAVERSVETDIDVLARIPVRQAASRVEAAEQGLRATKAQKRPSISVQSQYGLVGYSESFFPELDAFRDNWTVGAALQLPLYSGGRIEAEIEAARADVEEARAQLDQITELSRLDLSSALADLRAARATFDATAGTVEQAQRGVELAQLRYREGVSIPLEVQNARLLLEQARVNRAQAARDLVVAQTRVELLPALPLAASAGSAVPRQPASQQGPSQERSFSMQQGMPASANPLAGGVRR
jgi:outer membrane protein